MAINVFISYSTKDRSTVEAIVRYLERSLVIWWDRDLISGVKFEPEIFAKIARADVVIVAWSKNASASEWVPKESEYARGQKRVVIPVILDDTPLPSGLAGYNGIDLREWDQATETREMARLARDIRMHVGTTAKPDLAKVPTLKYPIKVSQEETDDSAVIGCLTLIFLVVVAAVAISQGALIALSMLFIGIGAAYFRVPRDEYSRTILERGSFILPCVVALCILVWITSREHSEWFGDISKADRESIRRTVSSNLDNSNILYGMQIPSDLIGQLDKFSNDTRLLCKAAGHAEAAALTKLVNLGYLPEEHHEKIDVPKVVGSLLFVEPRRPPAVETATVTPLAQPRLIDKLYAAGCLSGEWNDLNSWKSLSVNNPYSMSLSMSFAPPLIINVPTEQSWSSELRAMLSTNQVKSARALLEQFVARDDQAKETLGLSESNVSRTGRVLSWPARWRSPGSR